MSSRPSSGRFSRRKWVALMATAPVVAQVTSKVPPQGTPTPLEPPATPQARMKKAFDDVRSVGERLSHIEVPMDIEPAFSFKA